MKRFEVYWVSLDPTLGREIKKTRPCVVVSPDSMNHALSTVIVAPLTSTMRAYPTRVLCEMDGKQGQIALDQIRTIDKVRFLGSMGTLKKLTQQRVLKVLAEMFAE